jgi:hypothetical protein
VIYTEIWWPQFVWYKQIGSFWGDLTKEMGLSVKVSNDSRGLASKLSHDLTCIVNCVMTRIINCVMTLTMTCIMTIYLYLVCLSINIVCKQIVLMLRISCPPRCIYMYVLFVCLLTLSVNKCLRKFSFHHKLCHDLNHDLYHDN